MLLFDHLMKLVSDIFNAWPSMNAAVLGLSLLLIGHRYESHDHPLMLTMIRNPRGYN